MQASLMASPHPSAIGDVDFGVIKVITNTFANKDLKDFNQFIVSLNNISPNHSAKKLNEICNDYRIII